MTPQHHRTNRSGFTLIEILVVVSIIAILAGLGAAAFFRVYGMADRAATRSDIEQMQVAAGEFRHKFNHYPPSRIKLAYQLNTTNYPNLNVDPDNLDTFSVKYLTEIFGSRMVSTWQSSGIDWFGDGRGPTSKPVVLEGDQCLVYFLGGIPSNTGGSPSCTGFSTNPKSPGDLGGERIGPFFQFKGNRLKAIHADGVFFSYQDPYKKNYYAYFSAYEKSNGYNKFYLKNDPLSPAGTSDCQTLKVWPYAKSLGLTPEYQNSDRFQIICAGDKGKFGTGTALTGYTATGGYTGGPLWSPSTAAQANAAGDGKDDVSNFHTAPLGVSK